MKQVHCKNCGAVFSEDLEVCPFCGTMNRKGSYRSFRHKVAGFVDSMLGLKDEVHKSTGMMVLTAFLRSVLLIAVVIGLAFVFAQTARIDAYNDPKTDQHALETILWEDENIEKLDEAYAKDDFETIGVLYVENSNVVRRWSHYADYVLKDQCKNILEYPHFSSYQLQNVLYFLFYPDYYVHGYDIKPADPELYESLRQSVLKMMEEKGYTEQELSEIYNTHADNYGYVKLADLDAYVKKE
ncbi:MAG: zinc ribbon domain-containing protein [Solobacterium sp.]|nr:zinc ribbon domain-containing protein [Solobacterium sp.]